jgi:hydroxyethylthiazole kinase-like uncharacterized protein yjeF
LRELLDRHPLPELTGGKDESGTVLIIGGPPTCPGAVLLAGLAALRVGAGRVQLVVATPVAPAAAVARPEAMVVGWDQSGPVPAHVVALIEDAGAVLIGPGHERLARATVEAVVARAECPVVLDAGALPAAPALVEAANVVIAPNAVEARRLIDDPSGAPPALASELARRFERPVAVRGSATAIADATQSWLFDDAPSGLGTPGSGDVFVGVLSALLAAGMPTAGALAWAVELHAAAGALLAEGTPVGYLAGDVADQLPRALALAGRLTAGTTSRG